MSSSSHGLPICWLIRISYDASWLGRSVELLSHIDSTHSGNRLELLGYLPVLEGLHVWEHYSLVLRRHLHWLGLYENYDTEVHSNCGWVRAGISLGSTLISFC